jgi:DNA-binding winged helix-turn-helix (wHTH) protein
LSPFNSDQSFSSFDLAYGSKRLLGIRLIPHEARRRVLTRDGEPVPLPAKALEVLLALLQRPGETVSKDELMKAVWPDTFVEEDNLTQMIFLLREAPEDADGQSLIITVPRQGYRFVGNVTTAAPPRQHSTATEPSRTASRIAVHAMLPWAISGVLALIASAATWFALRPSRPAPFPLTRLSVDLGTAQLESRSTVALAPDGTRMVFVRGCGGWWLRICLICGQHRSVSSPRSPWRPGSAFSSIVTLSV